MLRAVPADEVERAVGVDPRFAQHALANDCRDLLVRPDILPEPRLRSRPEPRFTLQEIGSADISKGKAEPDEIVEAQRPCVGVFPAPDEDARGVHDGGGVPKPMEEVIRIAAHGAGQHGALDRPHPCPKAGPLLHEPRSRDAPAILAAQCLNSLSAQTSSGVSGSICISYETSEFSSNPRMRKPF